MNKVTETKKIKINHECVDNPIYLSWLNVYGGREYWLFGKLQDLGLNTASMEAYEPVIRNITNARRLTEEMGREANRTITLYAYVDREDIDGLSSILYSVNVEMLVSDDDFIKWVQVRPRVGSFNVGKTNEDRVLLTFTIELPYINIQGQ